MSQILSKKAMMAEQYEWDRKIQIYVTEHIQEAKQLLLELAVIPAPSGCEKQRADFCRRWLEQHGIPALTLGTIEGGKAHTREEWMNPDSLEQGMELVLRLLAAKCLFPPTS
jgi:acetylornithine deacetylase/succinyl-diaminopimelate desuccinylase-like protein